MNPALTLPHARHYRGKKLLTIWLGCVVGSWVGAYVILRAGIAFVRWLGALF